MVLMTHESLSAPGGELLVPTTNLASMERSKWEQRVVEAH